MATTSADLYDNNDHDWTQFSADERESFFAAIARHRRMSWRVTAISAIAIAMATTVVGVMTAPLAYAVIILALDLANFVAPTPDILVGIVDLIKAANADGVSIADWVLVAGIVIAPGVVWVSLLLFALYRALREAATLDAADLGAGPPTSQVLAEQRFANVVSEMSIAAGMSPPRVLVTALGHNAAIIGTDDEHATVVISQSLLSELNRAELQGVAAHLVGSLANGDVAIGLRSALVTCFFGVLSRMSAILSDDRKDVTSSLGAMARHLIVPTKAGARQLMATIADPFADSTHMQMRGARKPREQPPTFMKRVRAGIQFILMGPIVLTGFFGGTVADFFLGSMLGFAWRQRKYLADATAVRLTRDPDTLAHALLKMGGGRTIDSWADHLSVSYSGARGKFNGWVPMFPSVARRLTALQKLGSTVTFRRSVPVPLKGTLLGIAFFSVLGGLKLIAASLLAFLSVALSMFFLTMPVILLHALLRGMQG
jgi:Zn-dependent protease with chaperone function